MKTNFRAVSSFGDRKCGINTYTSCLVGGLNDLTSEIGRINVAAIDNSNERYDKTIADVVINQYDRDSWLSAAYAISDRAIEESNGVGNPTLLYVNHEFGLGGKQWDSDDNYVPFLKELRKTEAYKRGLLNVVSCLHTIRSDLPQFCKDVTKGIVENSDGTIVLAETGKKILGSDAYDIDVEKNSIKHITHGVRMYEYNEKDRRDIKQEWAGDEDIFLISTPGLISPGKGIFQYGVPAYAQTVAELEKTHPNIKTRKIIRGQCHPDFEESQDFNPFMKSSLEALSKSGLLLNKKNPFENKVPIEAMNRFKDKKHGIFFSYEFIPDKAYSESFGGVDLMEFVYLGKQQISSGQLSEAVGHGRDSVASKFWHACEMLSKQAGFDSLEDLLNPHKMPQEGKVIGINDPDAKGLLVDCDRGQQTIDQISEATQYAILNPEDHQFRSENAHEQGHDATWKHVGWLTQHYGDHLRKKKARIRDN